MAVYFTNFMPLINKAFNQIGTVVIYPTESVYGLGCRIDNQESIANILTLKQRFAGKGLLVLAKDAKDVLPLIDVEQLASSVADLEKIASIVNLDKSELQFGKKDIPTLTTNLETLRSLKPTPDNKLTPEQLILVLESLVTTTSDETPISLVLPAVKNKLTAPLMGDFSSIGIRFVKDERLLDILKAAKAPIVTTSANISGKGSTRSIDELLEAFELAIGIAENLDDIDELDLDDWDLDGIDLDSFDTKKLWEWSQDIANIDIQVLDLPCGKAKKESVIIDFNSLKVYRNLEEISNPATPAYLFDYQNLSKDEEEVVALLREIHAEVARIISELQ